MGTSIVQSLRRSVTLVQARRKWMRQNDWNA
jgi:hypothetical protein